MQLTTAFLPSINARVSCLLLYEHLIDGPIFSESKIRSPLQLADCIAYMVNHHYKSNKNKDENMKKLLEEGFEVIEQKMFGSKRYSRKVFP